MILLERIHLILLMRQLSPMETILDEANAVSLMLYLLDRTDKPASATDLLEVVKNYNRIKALAEQLRSLGLVHVETIKDRNVTFQYSLTQKGRDVAALLRRAVDMIATP
jgi:DNA-binding HxlR family transcriptional regulator